MMGFIEGVSKLKHSRSGLPLDSLLKTLHSFFFFISLLDFLMFWTKIQNNTNSSGAKLPLPAPQMKN